MPLKQHHSYTGTGSGLWDQGQELTLIRMETRIDSWYSRSPRPGLRTDRRPSHRSSRTGTCGCTTHMSQDATDSQDDGKACAGNDGLEGCEEQVVQQMLPPVSPTGCVSVTSWCSSITHHAVRLQTRALVTGTADRTPRTDMSHRPLIRRIRPYISHRKPDTGNKYKHFSPWYPTTPVQKLMPALDPNVIVTAKPLKLATMFDMEPGTSQRQLGLRVTKLIKFERIELVKLQAYEVRVIAERVRPFLRFTVFQWIGVSVSLSIDC